MTKAIKTGAKMLKIYGHFFSTPSLKVLMTANALGLEYEYHLINLSEGEQHSEEYSKINPLGKVPCIDDDGFILTESNSIVKYLCQKHHSVLYPEDLTQRAVINEWIDRSAIHLYQGIGKLFYNRMLKPSQGIESNEEEIKEGIEILGRYLPVFETALSSSTHIAGNELTLADIVLLSVLDSADAVQYDINQFKSVSAWRQYMMKQEFYLKVHAFFGEEAQQ
jgi:glutathione S-transferase